MNGKSIGRYWAYTLIGFIILAAGAIWGKNTREAQGIMLTLPYIMIGIGSGIFGRNLGITINVIAMKKAPQMAKQKEIEEKDERNMAIRNKAKARAYDLMVMVFGILMLTFALIQTDLIMLLAIVCAYLFVVFSNIFYISKYSKEM